MKKTRIVVVAAVVVALGAGFTAVSAIGGSGGDGGSAPAVTTVGGGSLEATVSAAGNLVPAQQLTLDFTNPGRLVEVNAKQGDNVTKGQILAKIDDRAAQDELARTSAAADDANARLRGEPTSANRLAVATAAAELHTAQRALTDTSLVAPVDALVNTVGNRPGELVGRRRSPAQVQKPSRIRGASSS